MNFLKISCVWICCCNLCFRNCYFSVATSCRWSTLAEEWYYISRFRFWYIFLCHVIALLILPLLASNEERIQWHRAFNRKPCFSVIVLGIFSSPVVCLCHGFMSVVDRAPCSRLCLCRA